MRSTISIRQVDQILLGARRHGLDCDRLLQRAGIAPALLRSTLARVSVPQYARLMSVLRRSLRDELWGLCHQPLPPGAYVSMAGLMLSRPTLGDALQVGGRLFRTYRTGLSPRVVRGDTDAGLSIHVHGELDAGFQYAVRVFAYHSYRLACWLVAERIPLVRVALFSQDHGRIDDTTHLFETPVVHSGMAAGWYCDPAWMSAPPARSAADLATLLDAAPASLIVKFRDENAIGERVRRLLRRRLGHPMPTQEEAASALSLAPKTMNRRLLTEGHGGFRALRDAFLRDVAIEQLTHGNRSIADITQLLGFSEPSTFHRAFKHWTGVAPGTYRRGRLQ